MLFFLSAAALAGENLATCHTIALDGEAAWEDFRLEKGDPCEGHLFRGEEKLTESCATSAAVCDTPSGRFVVAAAFGASALIEIDGGEEIAVPGQAWTALIATTSAVLLPFDDAVESGSTRLMRASPEAGLVYALKPASAREIAKLDLASVAVEGDALTFSADVFCDARVWENDGQPQPARCFDAEGEIATVGRMTVKLAPKNMEAEVSQDVTLHPSLGGARVGGSLGEGWSPGEQPGTSTRAAEVGGVPVNLIANVDGGVVRGLVAEVKPDGVEAVHAWALETWGQPDAQDAVGSRLQWIWRRGDCAWKWVRNGEGAAAMASVNCD